MHEEVRILPMSRGEFAAEVDEGEQTTRHRVRVTEDLLDDLGLVDVDEGEVVRESLRYLLTREPNTALEHDIDLTAVERADPDYLPELRARLAG